MKELATQKLTQEWAELRKSKPDQYIRAMAPAVLDALKEFVQQDNEFAQAVVQGGAFADCMKKVSGGVKSGAISDLDAYRLAVQFYFPGADIRCQMTVNLCASVEQDSPETDKAVVLDLFDLL